MFNLRKPTQFHDFKLNSCKCLYRRKNQYCRNCVGVWGFDYKSFLTKLSNLSNYDVILNDHAFLFLTEKIYFCSHILLKLLILPNVTECLMEETYGDIGLSAVFSCNYASENVNIIRWIYLPVNLCTLNSVFNFHLEALPK